ncbi:ABC transporter ATP-binding protein [Roseobacter sp. N2S]|uniref:ABC transporter ATP-binding protein n=1 Tax=Roseobacter sp. N2S TaxID=2663844 RepID=UPI00285D2ADE|nr:ABC transporter ATP-binding protein [Roseobacter sp. N2S]MDR6264192.1 branched-chain amino acid transport system ATP-binding protein [Roseobacter sp. N2S]
MLELSKIQSGYGRVQVLFDVSLTAKAGEITCIMGRNGAGKTTTLKTIMGMLPMTAGAISLDGVDLASLPPHKIPTSGIAYVPQGRRLFSELTVAQNLEVGLLHTADKAATREEVLTLFPRLRERLKQQADTLSGGEQQMLAMGRALCLRPKVLLLDEPTEGLQPSMIDLIRDVVIQMKSRNLAVILVEQRIDAVLNIADQVVFVENGRSLETTDTDALRENPEKLHHYLGV